ncbi:MAG: type VI secretion system protein TssA [Dyella sp.]
MPTFDLEPLLAPLEAPSPTGDNLEYQPEFLALEELAQIKNERAVGDTIKAAEEPDWDRVAAQAQQLLGQSKDLRVALHLTTAWLRSDGLPGWCAGVALVRGLLERYWDAVHPQLDAQDDNDSTARVNAVSAMIDSQGMLGYLRSANFVQSPRLGQFSLRDLRVANGSQKAVAGESSSGEPPTMTVIEACCQDCPVEQLTANFEAIEQALEHIRTIDRIFIEQLGTAGPDFKVLLTDLTELRTFVYSHLVQRIPTLGNADSSDEGDEGNGAHQDSSTSSTPQRGVAEIISGPQDVLRALETLCDYYAKHEPSSPIPLLLRRAQRMVGMNFTDLLKDLAPGGLSDLRLVAGVIDE